MLKDFFHLLFYPTLLIPLLSSSSSLSFCLLRRHEININPHAHVSILTVVVNLFLHAHVMVTTSSVAVKETYLLPVKLLSSALTLPLLFLLLLYFIPLYLVVVYLCKFWFFSYSKAAVSVVSTLLCCSGFIIYSLCLFYIVF